MWDTDLEGQRAVPKVTSYRQSTERCCCYNKIPPSCNLSPATYALRPSGAVVAAVAGAAFISIDNST